MESQLRILVSFVIVSLRQLTTRSALVTAAVYADRYVPDRYLPDKAIDLIDESCASLKLAQESRPAVLEQLDR